MEHIHPIHFKKFEKFLFYVGCKYVRQKGDHRIYKRATLKSPLVVPVEKELPIFIIRNNLRILGINPSEYLKILSQI